MQVVVSISPVQSLVSPKQKDLAGQAHEAPQHLPAPLLLNQSGAPQLNSDVAVAKWHDDHVKTVDCGRETNVTSPDRKGRHAPGSPAVDVQDSFPVSAGATELDPPQDTLSISSDAPDEFLEPNTSRRNTSASLETQEDESEEEQEQSDSESDYEDSDIVEDSTHSEHLTGLSSSVRRRDSQQLSPPRLSIGSPPVQRRLPRLTQAILSVERLQPSKADEMQLMVKEIVHRNDTSYFQKSRNMPLSISQKGMPPPPSPIPRHLSPKHAVTTANSTRSSINEKPRDENPPASKKARPTLLEVRCEIHRDPSVAPTTPPPAPLQAPTSSPIKSWSAELRRKGRSLLERDASAVIASRNQDETTGEADTTLVGDIQADENVLDEHSQYSPRNSASKAQSHNKSAKRHRVDHQASKNEIRTSHQPLHNMMIELADVCHFPHHECHEITNRITESDPPPG